ncbi:MAG: hypothetical protein L0H31_06535 [Nocardioidaceae bacterium]|nr:hypothetical protein [Nocardioidaceae bacterium]
MNLEDVMTTHADRATAQELTLREVRTRAQRIQRHRRAGVTAGVAAAVAAVVLPISLLVGGNPRSAPPPPGPAKQTSLIDADAVQQDPLDMQIAQAKPGGVPPRPAWIQGQTLHRLDGSRVRLDQTYNELDVVNGETYLGVRSDLDPDSGASIVDEIGDDGQVASTRKVAGLVGQSVTMSADHSIAAWTTPEGDVQVWDRDGESTLTNTGPSRPPGNAVAVFGSETCDQTGSGCSVVVNPPSSMSGAPITYSTAEPDGTPVGHGFRYLHAVSPDGTLYSGIRKLGEPGGTSCSATWDLTKDNQDMELHNCTSSPFEFSPDSTHTAENSPQRDGEPASIEIRDARTADVSVKILAEGDSTTSVIDPVIWEDAENYLVTALHRGKWLLLRGDLQGRLEIVAGPIAPTGEPFSSPYVIAR